MRKKNNKTTVQTEQYTPYDVSGKISSDAFEVLGADAKSMELLARPSVSFMKDAWNRIRKSRVAVICMIILGMIILGAIFCPMLTPFSYSEQNVAFQNKPIMSPDSVTGQMHIFGTDALGRDVFSGYFGGAVDNVMMRIVEIISGIPYLIIVILLMTVMERGLGTIIVAYSLTGWTGMARLVRGQVVGLKEQEFVIAAKSMGASPARIIGKHLVPNVLSVIIVNITLDIPNVIFTEAFLSMLGLGIAPPKSSWGIMANDAIKVFQMFPTQLVIVALFICVTMLSFNLLGDQLRDAFDPKLRR